MFNNLSFKSVLILFALFCVASSKGILIYNEETLVGLSFLSFVIFSFHYFGNRLQESLDSRSFLIKSEQENLNKLKQENLSKVVAEHKKIANLKAILSQVAKFTEQELLQSKSSGAQSISLSNRFNFQVEQKLNQFQSSKNALEFGLRKSIASTFYSFVLVKTLKASRKKRLKKLLAMQVKKSIQSLNQRS